MFGECVHLSTEDEQVTHREDIHAGLGPGGTFSRQTPVGGCHQQRMQSVKGLGVWKGWAGGVCQMKPEQRLGSSCQGYAAPEEPDTCLSVEALE